MSKINDLWPFRPAPPDWALNAWASLGGRFNVAGSAGLAIQKIAPNLFGDGYPERGSDGDKCRPWLGGRPIMWDDGETPGFWSRCLETIDPPEGQEWHNEWDRRNHMTGRRPIPPLSGEMVLPVGDSTAFFRVHTPIAKPKLNPGPYWVRKRWGFPWRLATYSYPVLDILGIPTTQSPADWEIGAAIPSQGELAGEPVTYTRPENEREAVVTPEDRAAMDEMMERVGGPKAGATLTPEEAFARIQRGEWITNGPYAWTNEPGEPETGGRYWGQGPYPGCVRSCPTFTLSSVQYHADLGRPWRALTPVVDGEEKPERTKGANELWLEEMTGWEGRLSYDDWFIGPGWDNEDAWARVRKKRQDITIWAGGNIDRAAGWSRCPFGFFTFSEAIEITCCTLRRRHESGEYPLPCQLAKVPEGFTVVDSPHVPSVDTIYVPPDFAFLKADGSLDQSAKAGQWCQLLKRPADDAPVPEGAPALRAEGLSGLAAREAQGEPKAPALGVWLGRAPRPTEIRKHAMGQYGWLCGDRPRAGWWAYVDRVTGQPRAACISGAALDYTGAPDAAPARDEAHARQLIEEWRRASKTSAKLGTTPRPGDWAEDRRGKGVVLWVDPEDGMPLVLSAGGRAQWLSPGAKVRSAPDPTPESCRPVWEAFRALDKVRNHPPTQD